MTYVMGDWNATCSMCGRKRKASELVRHWQGQYRCPEHDEPRHPQEFVRSPPVEKLPPWTQPPAEVFISFCTTRSSVVDDAVVECAIVDQPLAGA